MTAIAAKRQSPDERRAAILEAAAAVFFDQGYAATSIDAIIDRLGGSKRTIYQEFGSKEGLFTGLVADITEKALAALEAADLDPGNLRQTLLEFGRRLMRIYTSPTILGLYRTIVTEGHRFPDLARAFYDKGAGRAAARLREVLEAANASGDAQVGDCAIAADHFVGMLRDNFHLRLVLGLEPPPSAQQIEAVAAVAVDIFLDGIRGDRRSSHGGGGPAPA